MTATVTPVTEDRTATPGSASGPPLRPPAPIARTRPSSRRTGIGIAVLVAVVGLLATAGATIAVIDEQRNDAEIRTTAALERASAQLELEVGRELAALVSLRNDVQLDWPMSRAEFHAVVESHLGDGLFAKASAVEIIRAVQRGPALDAFVAETSADPSLVTLGYPELEVPEFDAETAFVIDYVVPIETNEAAFGFDVAIPAGRADIISRARDEAIVAATHPIELVQGGRALIVDVPLYEGGAVPDTVTQRRQDFLGAVTAVLRLDDLVAPVVAAEPAVELQVVEPNGPDGPILVTEGEGWDDSASGVQRATASVADREWVVAAQPVESAGGLLPTSIAFGGTAVTLMLAAMVAALERSRARTRRAAEETGRARDELADLNADLENRIADRTAELERSNADLEQFAYLASHDLQEPLRQVSMFVDRLDERYGDAFDERGTKYLGFVTEGTQRMRNLISALLDYSRVGSRDVAIAAVDLDVLVGEVVASIGATVGEAGAQVHVDAPVEVRTDRILVQRIVQNLVENAVRYRRPGVAPVVHVSAEKVAGGVRLTVADNGQGIDPEYAERAFDLFERLGSRDPSSTGMGLAICRRSTEMLGGRIWIEPNEDGPGTKVIVEIPNAS